MHPFKFVTDCVHSNGPDIQEMVDQAQQVTWATFWKHVSRSEVWALPGFLDCYTWGIGKGLRIEKDYAVSVYRSKFQGRLCYYIEHSLIEYVFQEKGE